MQLPVLTVEGEQPEWWLWDSHVASDIERKASDWQLVRDALRAMNRAAEFLLRPQDEL